MKAWVLAVAACGSSAPPPDAPIACAATLSGNVGEHDACTVTAPLAIAIPSAALGTSIAIAIDVGGSPGAYSPANVASWSATALQRIGNGACDYSAGAGLVPSGDFALDLEAGGHGTLTVSQYVLGTPGTDCGDADTERIDVSF